MKTWKIQRAEVDLGGHLRPEPDERIHSLTDEEETRLFEHLREDYADMVTFTILSGLRLSNVLRLTWQQVDLDEGVINLRIKSKKYGGKNHVVPLTPQMSAILAMQKGHNPIFLPIYAVGAAHRGMSFDVREPVTLTVSKAGLSIGGVF